MKLERYIVWKGVCLTACLFLLLACQVKTERSDSVTTTAVTSEEEAAKALLELYKTDLSELISSLEKLKNSVGNPEAARHQYSLARSLFKQAEPLLWAADKQNYLALNGPNLLKVEEEDATDIKIKEPFGFQRLEEELFADEVDTEAVARTTEKTLNWLKLLYQNAYIKLEKRHVLWLVRDAVVRVATTGITGFDSPVLENSLEESAVVYTRLAEILAIYQNMFAEPSLYQAWQNSIELSRKELLSGNFANFNRYAFIGQHTHHQMLLWTETVDDWQVEFPFEMAISHTATSLFSPETFNLPYFSDNQQAAKAGLVELGNMLFNETALSANGKMSCGTCHQAEKAFADGLKLFPGQQRNTPTLLYAGLQKGFFYDKRAGSLEGQIVNVVNNELEFHSNLDSMAAVVGRMPKYKQAFDSLYEDGTNERHIRQAIAAYIRSLSPFNSRFDKSIRGEEESLTQEEIRGFNLFTGKAKCATCHFAPVFNGTIPPNFAESELEMLGVPNHAQNPSQVDADGGRYAFLNTEALRFFFKTPTVRNSNRTAPYMHNGVYTTLEEVVDFYNKGGGEGLGLDSPNQTLPPDPLNLSPEEVSAIVSFIKSLDDEGRASL